MKAQEKRQGSEVITSVMRGPTASIMNPPNREPAIDVMDGREAEGSETVYCVTLILQTQQQQHF